MYICLYICNITKLIEWVSTWVLTLISFYDYEYAYNIASSKSLLFKFSKFSTMISDSTMYYCICKFTFTSLCSVYTVSSIEYTYLYIYIYIRVYIYIYIYILVHIHTRIYEYIYLYCNIVCTCTRKVFIAVHKWICSKNLLYYVRLVRVYCKYNGAIFGIWKYLILLIRRRMIYKNEWRTLLKIIKEAWNQAHCVH